MIIVFAVLGLKALFPCNWLASQPFCRCYAADENALTHLVNSEKLD